MSIRGVWQLSKLSIVHCRSQGSSRGAREFVQSTLPLFQAANPQLAVDAVLRNNRHPYVLAHYLNGVTQQIDVKNSDSRHILDVCNQLRNKTGRPIKRKWPAARSRTPSVQGFWNPAFNHSSEQEQMRRAVERDMQLIGVAPPFPAAAASPASSSSSSVPASASSPLSSTAARSASSPAPAATRS